MEYIVSEQTITVSNMGEFHKHNLEGKKLDTKGYVLYFIYMNFKKAKLISIRNQAIVYLQKGLSGGRWLMLRR